tara:strand:- start:102 stop:467 length:366 start_codon:yes stop_codon:yes gene_type:complete
MIDEVDDEVQNIIKQYSCFCKIHSSELTAFNTTYCEVCGVEALAPNPMTVQTQPYVIDGLISLLKEAGFAILPLPPELHHCEALGLATCDDCWVDEINPCTACNCTGKMGGAICAHCEEEE